MTLTTRFVAIVIVVAAADPRRPPRGCDEATLRTAVQRRREVCRAGKGGGGWQKKGGGGWRREEGGGARFGAAQRVGLRLRFAVPSLARSLSSSSRSNFRTTDDASFSRTLAFLGFSQSQRRREPAPLTHSLRSRSLLFVESADPLESPMSDVPMYVPRSARYTFDLVASCVRNSETGACTSTASEAANLRRERHKRREASCE
jgi:hypothetical protein